MLGSTALPPGTYTPTRSIARGNRLHTTPGIVSTCITSPFGAQRVLGAPSGAATLASTWPCAAWKRRMLSYATSIALRTSGAIASRSAAVWNGGCRTCGSGRTRSSFAVYSSSAASPRLRTSARIGRTRSSTASVRIAGRCSSGSCCAGVVSCRRYVRSRMGASGSSGSAPGFAGGAGAACAGIAPGLASPRRRVTRLLLRSRLRSISAMPTPAATHLASAK